MVSSSFNFFMTAIIAHAFLRDNRLSFFYERLFKFLENAHTSKDRLCIYTIKDKTKILHNCYDWGKLLTNKKGHL